MKILKFKKITISDANFKSLSISELKEIGLSAEEIFETAKKINDISKMPAKNFPIIPKIIIENVAEFNNLTPEIKSKTKLKGKEPKTKETKPEKILTNE
jgi:hypothetical protein